MRNYSKMDFDFNQTWLEWYPDEKEWYTKYFTELYDTYRLSHNDDSEEFCQESYKKMVSYIVSIISKGLFVKANEIRREIYNYHSHKNPRRPDDDCAYRDQANIKQFLSHLDLATDIEFELRARTIHSELLNVDDTFLTIMAINIKWLDSEGKIRHYNGLANGGRVEASLHFHTLFLDLGWDDHNKIKTHIYREEDDFMFYIDALRAYFSKFIEHNHYTSGIGLKPFGEACRELASFLWHHIDELSAENCADKLKVAKIIVDLFRIPNDMCDDYKGLEYVVKLDVFSKYFSVL